MTALKTHTYRNVLQLTDYGAPYPGNFVASLVCLERMLNGLGHGMVTVFPRRARDCDWVTEGKETPSNVHTIRDKGFFAYYRQVRTLLKRYDVDIVHVHFIHFAEKLAALLACRTCGHRVLTVCHLHNHLGISKNFWKSLPQRLYIRKVQRFLCCSRSVAEQLIGDGVAKEKVAVAENAIAFARLEKSSPVDRALLGIAKDDRIVLIFGFDFLRKGVDLAIEAVRQLRTQEQLPITLAVSLSSRREEAVQAACSQLGVETLPSWIVPLPPRDDIASYYHMADVFVSPSREEGFCYALVEAVYCKTPVVASAINAQKDLALPEDVFCVPCDAADLAAHIRKQLMEKDLPSSAENRRLAQERVESTYCLDAWSKVICRQYEEITNG